MILVVAVRCKSFEQLQDCLKCQTMRAYRWPAIIDVNWVVAAPKRLGLDRILIRWDLQEGFVVCQLQIVQSDQSFGVGK